MSQAANSKIILITGSSSGFGLLTAAHLASKNHKVIATMRNLEKKTALLNEVSRRGGEVEVVKLDVTDKETIEAAIDHVSVHHGQIDVLINNAGYGIGGFFEDLTDEEIRQQMETNFFGVLNVTRAAIPLMRQPKGSKIINISSVAGFSASPCFGAYDASKWALEAFSESLRYELSFFDIDVLLIEPGTYNTPIFHDNARYAERFDDPNSPYFSMSQHFRKYVQDYVKQCPKDPADVAKLVEKLINTKNPPFRNMPDKETKMLRTLRTILPFKLYSQMISKAIYKGFQK